MTHGDVGWIDHTLKLHSDIILDLPIHIGMVCIQLGDNDNCTNSNALTIAQDMALGLAAGHWAARANLLDIEYVIGSRHLTLLVAHILALDAGSKSILVNTVLRVLNQINKSNFTPAYWH
ncbi:unnamed protein product [Clonostachys byssicola]|uniref:Uncharacterized protein n=1 Tax=Clonostachys byssicola TaxID=160290 RepID=A0A9N9UN83_9HYPO|nr:unnamed protein product [Clonostachys byssicola]